MEDEKFMHYYENWIKTKKMPDSGLCRSLSNKLLRKSAFKLTEPTNQERFEIQSEGGDYIFWGKTPNSGDKTYTFGALRQTLVLLAACLNGEDVHPKKKNDEK